MIEVKGINGDPLTLNESTISRVRTLVTADKKKETKIDFAGGYIFSLEPAVDIIKRIAKTVSFVSLTARDGKPVWLNPTQVLSFRPAVPINGPGTEINIGGLYQHVLENYDKVRTLLGIS